VQNGVIDSHFFALIRNGLKIVKQFPLIVFVFELLYLGFDMYEHEIYVDVANQFRYKGSSDCRECQPEIRFALGCLEYQICLDLW
jgi:hypothetical protein